METSESAADLEAKTEAQLASGESPAPDAPTPEPQAAAPEVPVSAEPSTVPTGEQPLEPSPDAPQEPAPATPEPEPVKANDANEPLERVRTNLWNDVDALAATITAKSGGKIPLKEALAQAEQMLAKADVTTPTEDPIATLEAEQKEIQARLDQAAEDGTVFTSDIRKDQRREAEILLEIRDAKAAKAAAEAESQRQQAEAADTAFDTQWQADVAEVLALYGDTANDDGPLGKAMLAEYDKAAADPKHRFHAEFVAGTLSPLTVAPLVAARLRIPTVGSAAPAPTPTPAAPVQPVTRAPLPVSGGARTTPAAAHNAATTAAAFQQRLLDAQGDADKMARILEEKLSGADAEVPSIRLA